MFDFLINKFYSNKWKLNEEYSPFTYTIQKNQKIKLNDDKNLVLYKNPSYYNHYTISQHNKTIVIFFIAISIIQNKLLYKLYKKTKNNKIFFFNLLSISSSIYEIYIAFTRIKDPYEINLIENGKVLEIKVYQKKCSYKIDIKDLRLISKSANDSYFFIDASKKKNHNIFIIDPNHGNCCNFNVLKYVIEDRRYLNYNV